MSLEHKIKNRKWFELILDTNVLGKKILSATAILLDHIEKEKKEIYSHGARVILPLQIGIESKSLIFPEFLDIALSDPDKNDNLRTFYKSNKHRIEILDSDISKAYKYVYTFKAIKKLGNDTQFIKKIIDDALDLSKKFYPEDGFFDSASLESAFEKLRDKYELVKSENRPKFKENSYKIDKFVKEKNITDKPLIKAIKDNSEMKITAKSLKKILSEDENKPHTLQCFKLLMQAMYSNNSIMKQVSADDSFKKFRLDKGERETESILFGKRRKTNFERVTLVITEDQGAKLQIQKLRRASENTIIALSSHGFSHLMKGLELINNSETLYNSDTKFLLEKRKNKAEKALSKNQSSITDHFNPASELKYAERVIELVNYGWFEHQNTTKKNKSWTNKVSAKNDIERF